MVLTAVSTMEILEEFIELYYKKLKPGGTCIVWFDWEKITPMVQMMKKNKFKQSRWFVWIKTNPQPLSSGMKWHWLVIEATGYFQIWEDDL